MKFFPCSGKESQLTTQLIESLSDAQFKTLNLLVNDPYGIEALRLAMQIKTLRLAHFGTIASVVAFPRNPNN